MFEITGAGSGQNRIHCQHIDKLIFKNLKNGLLTACKDKFIFCPLLPIKMWTVYEGRLFFQEKETLKQTVAQLKANIEGLQSAQVKQDELEVRCMTSANENTKLQRQMETLTR